MKTFISILISLSIAAVSSVAQVSDWKPMQTPAGQPDLQGVWGNNTITPVERLERFGERQYLTDEEQMLLERLVSEIADEDGDALFGRLCPERPAPHPAQASGLQRAAQGHGAGGALG